MKDKDKGIINDLVKLAGIENALEEAEVKEAIKDYPEVTYNDIVKALNKLGIAVIKAKAADYDEIGPDFEDLDSEEDVDVDKMIQEADRDNELSALSNDPVRVYLKEIGQIPLLKADEEQKLGKQVYDARIAKQFLENAQANNEELDKKTINMNLKLIEKGEEAASKLTEANYRLVVSIAKKYERSGMNFLDLIQDGNMGLMKAVEKYEYQKGFKFSTYATWWIRQAISRSIAEKSRTIRIPVHMNETINKMNKIKRELMQDIGREPTDEEIANKLGESVEKIQYIKSIARDPMSLETPVGEEDDSALGDFISDPNSVTPQDFLEKELLTESLDDILEKYLTDKEEKIIRMRYGQFDGKEYTLEEIGKIMGITRERVRQIENKALDKLRTKAGASEKLKPFYVK